MENELLETLTFRIFASLKLKKIPKRIEHESQKSLSQILQYCSDENGMWNRKKLTPELIELLWKVTHQTAVAYNQKHQIGYKNSVTSFLCLFMIEPEDVYKDYPFFLQPPKPKNQ